MQRGDARVRQTKMKKIILILALVMMVSLVSAQVPDGTILTQSQVNNINPFTVNLGCREDSRGVEGFWFIIRGSCQDLLDNENGTYTVIRKEGKAAYSLMKYVLCLTNEPQSVCVEKAKIVLTSRIASFIQQIRNHIESLQIHEYDQYEEDFEDIEPFE